MTNSLNSIKLHIIWNTPRAVHFAPGHHCCWYRKQYLAESGDSHTWAWSGLAESSKSDILCSGNLHQFNDKLPSWQQTHPLPAATFQDDSLFPRWDMLVPWRVSIMKQNAKWWHKNFYIKHLPKGDQPSKKRPSTAPRPFPRPVQYASYVDSMQHAISGNLPKSGN